MEKLSIRVSISQRLGRLTRSCSGAEARETSVGFAVVLDQEFSRELADHALRRKGLKTPFYAVQRDRKVQQDGEVVDSRIDFTAVGLFSPCAANRLEG